MTHTIDNLFESESLLGDPNDLDNLVEFRDEPDHNLGAEEAHEEDGGENEDEVGESNEAPNKKSEEKKVSRVKRPQPKLDAERLKGPRGLLALPKSFADFKFHGKGREAEDLSRLLARLEHWAHRLFPKLQFDDFLEKVEKLGSKKVVQNYLKRIRMGMEESADSVERLGDSDTEEGAGGGGDPPADEPMDEFDRLLAEQVSYYQNSTVTSVPPTPSPMRPPMATSSTSSSLTAEQKERIERNRKAAMEKRQNRLAAALSPVTPPPPPISPLPGDANATGSEETTKPESQHSVTKTQNLPHADEENQPQLRGDQSDSVSTKSPSPNESVDVSKEGANVSPSSDENIPPEPTTSAHFEEISMPKTPCGSPLDTNDDSDTEKSGSPVEGSSLKRSGICDESSHPEKKLRKDFPTKETTDSGSGDDSQDFADHLEKISSDGMENDNDLSNSETDNNNIKENGSQAGNTPNNSAETLDDPEK